MEMIIMTDREEFEQFITAKDYNISRWENGKYTNFTTAKSWESWEARGVLATAETKKLEAYADNLEKENKRHIVFNMEQKSEIAELTAKLDKAREAMGSVCYYRGEIDTLRETLEELKELDE